MTSDYNSMKVAQLRSLCKSRGLEADGRKDELIAALVRSDEVLAMASSQESVPRDPFQPTSTEPPLSGEDLRELATIVDEMKHLRRQWLLQVPRQGQGFVHQGYGLSTARKA